MSPSTLRDPIYDKLSCIPLGSYFSGSRITCLLSILSFLAIASYVGLYMLILIYPLGSIYLAESGLRENPITSYPVINNLILYLFFLLLTCGLLPYQVGKEIEDP